MSTFYLDYNVTGEERKRLVKAIAAYTQVDAKYLGVPSCAYQVNYFTIDRTGCVTFDDRADSEEIEGLIEALVDQGFVSLISNLGAEDADDDEQDAEPAEAEPSDAKQAEAEPDSADEINATEGLNILLPLDGFNPDSLDRLQKLVDSKASLIRKALGADRLTIQLVEDAVRFPWWDAMPTPEEIQAYSAFLAALCRMAKEAKRVTATEKEVESEKYAFRGFLLRLGFIGADSKAQRKVLLKNLSGASAFPNKAAADAFAAAQKAKRDAAKAAASVEPATETAEEVVA